MTETRQTNEETEKERLRETKERVTEQREVYAVCQHKESEMSVFCAASVSDGCHYPTQWV